MQRNKIIFHIFPAILVIIYLFSPIEGIAEEGTLKWTSSIEPSTPAFWGPSSPAIGADGTIYVVSEDCNLLAIESDGTQKWIFEAGNGGYCIASVSIYPDGTIYFGSNYEEGKLYAINPNGILKWIFQRAPNMFTAPAIAANGTLYLADTLIGIYALNSDGTQKWMFRAEDVQRDAGSFAAIGIDGTIYVGKARGINRAGRLYAINPDGSLKWEYQTGGVSSSVAIGADGTIYVGSNYYSSQTNTYPNQLHAINPNGTLRWSFKTGGSIYQAPAIGADGTVYVGSNDFKLYAINPNGTLRWSFETEGGIGSSPAIGADGTVYIGSNDFKLYAINPNGTLRWSFKTGGSIYQAPAIGADGTVYVSSDDNRLYAINGNSGGLANSPWPMSQHDVMRTGLVKFDLADVILKLKMLTNMEVSSSAGFKFEVNGNGKSGMEEVIFILQRLSGLRSQPKINSCFSR